MHDPTGIRRRLRPLGGAGLGAIQVGMLRALYERGIQPDVIVATSAGAINGALIATRPQTVETVDALAEIWRHVRRGQVFPSTRSPGLLGFLGTRRKVTASRPSAVTYHCRSCLTRKPRAGDSNNKSRAGVRPWLLILATAAVVEVSRFFDRRDVDLYLGHGIEAGRSAADRAVLADREVQPRDAVQPPIEEIHAANFLLRGGAVGRAVNDAGEPNLGETRR